jgi:AcrR family transcriptional regulator
MVTRRAQILDTAATLFAERGFHGVSITELGAACGISGPAFYKHFPSKDALLEEMLIEISEELLRVGRERVLAAADAAHAVRALVEWHADFAVHHQPLIVLQDRDWSSLRDEARDRVRFLQRRYADLWTGELRKVWPELTAREALAQVHACFGLINSTPHSTRLGDAQMCDLLVQMACRALRVADSPGAVSQVGSPADLPAGS